MTEIGSCPVRAATRSWLVLGTFVKRIEAVFGWLKIIIVQEIFWETHFERSELLN